MSKVVASLVLFFIASASSAQVIYEPVQYQYGREGNRYYYGGSDPMIHHKASLLSQQTGYGRTNGWAFASGNIHTHREVAREPMRAYSDMMTTQNATFFGYTDNDARNAAYANSPTYFRKSELLKTAQLQADGTWLVRSDASAPSNGTIVIKPYVAPSKKVEPTPVLIIPKRLLDKPLWGSGNPQASAD